MYINNKVYCNSKCQGFKTVQTIKIQKKKTKFGPKKFIRINDYAKPTKKDESEKKEGVLESCLRFSSLLFCWFLIIIYTKKFFWSKFGPSFFVYNYFINLRNITRIPIQTALRLLLSHHKSLFPQKKIPFSSLIRTHPRLFHNLENSSS